MGEDTVWLSQAQMAELFGTKRQAITKHLQNIYESDELKKEATSSILELVRKEGDRTVKRKVEFYNLGKEVFYVITTFLYSGRETQNLQKLSQNKQIHAFSTSIHGN